MQCPSDHLAHRSVHHRAIGAAKRLLSYFPLSSIFVRPLQWSIPAGVAANRMRPSCPYDGAYALQGSSALPRGSHRRSGQVSNPWKRPLPAECPAGPSPDCVSGPDRGDRLTWRERAAAAPACCRCLSAGLLRTGAPPSEGFLDGAPCDAACIKQPALMETCALFSNHFSWRLLVSSGECGHPVDLQLYCQ